MKGKVINSASVLCIGALIAAATGAVLASEEARKSDRERVDRLFERYDANGDGAIDRNEAANVRMHRFHGADGDGDGALTFAELRDDAVRRAERRAERIFARLDGDGDGVIDAAEIATYRSDRNRARRDRIFRRFDADDDGRITREEIVGK